MRFWFSRLQSASVYWRNELRVGPLVAHLQTIFVTAVSSSNTSSKSPNIVSTKPQRIIVHQPSSPLPVMRAPCITTCRLLTRFVPVNTFIGQNAVAIVSPPGKWCGSKKKTATLDWLADLYLLITQTQCCVLSSWDSLSPVFFWNDIALRRLLQLYLSYRVCIFVFIKKNISLCCVF